MAGELHTTDPAECFGTSVYGFGPFPLPGETVVDCSTQPVGAGFGGVGWASSPYEAPPAGTPYGLGPYGCVLDLGGAPDLALEGGYGGDPYGLGSYGSIDTVPPRITGAVSISAWEIEVFFSEEMDEDNPALLDPASYILTAMSYAATTETESVTVGTRGSIGAWDSLAAPTSVIVRHKGTTQGGAYSISAVGPTDLNGSPLLPITIPLLTRGAAPPYEVTPSGNGEQLLFKWRYPMLPGGGSATMASVGSTGGSVGSGDSLEDMGSYRFESSPEFPVLLTPLSAEFPYGGDYTESFLSVMGMTSLEYTAYVSPAYSQTYDGSTLPSASETCDGEELNPLGGASLPGDYLRLLRYSTRAYGWEFRERAGAYNNHLLPDSTMRVDFTFNAQQATYSPPLSGLADFRLGTLTVEDGPVGTGVRIELTFNKALDDYWITVQCGAYALKVEAAWLSGTNTVSVVRNMLAGIYTVLWNEHPLMSTALSNFTEPSEDGPRVTWLMPAEAVRVDGVQVWDVNVTATQTVFSGVWNFAHEHTSTFTGSTTATRDTLLTEKGPLVKDWGDATPATKQDVSVLVNGTAIEVEDVNPWIGQVWTTIPIPLMPPGMIDVQVDYKWQKKPVMEFQALNTEGLVLNQWDRDKGNTFPVHPGYAVQDATHPKGAASITRFPFGTVLGPLVNPTPLHIGHRYMGFERDYSALTNSPTTLLLNQSPFRTSTDAFERMPEGVSVAYEGIVDPLLDDPVWILTGTDGGAPNGDGTYTVSDDSNEDAALYWREVDLTFPSTINMVARFIVDSYTVDGVFTGVGFGIHNNYELFMAGALLVNGLEHVGMILDPRYPEQLASWEIGHTTATLLTQSTLSVTTSEIPSGLAASAQFQILTGPQAGVYTITNAVAQCDGTTTLTISGTFPANVRHYGNNDPELYFETKWSESLASYRLTVDPDSKSAVLTMSGSTTMTLVTLDGTAPTVPQPADTTLLLSTDYTGQAFWGGVSRAAKNQSTWSFVRYGVVPDASTIRGHALTTATNMDLLPELDTDDEWFTRQAFGFAETSGGSLLLKSTSANASLNFGYSYERIEPFFTQDSNLDLRAQYHADSGNLGAGDAEIVLNDGTREVRLATLLYREGFSHPYRRLIDLPVESIAGMLLPTDQGWALVAASDGSAASHEADLVTTVEAGQIHRYSASLTANPDVPDGGDRILEARLAVDSYTAVGDDTGIFFAGEAEDAPFHGYVEVRLLVGRVALVDSMGGTIHSFVFAWDDGEFHTYRVVASNGGVVLSIDDTIQSPTLSLTSFGGGTGTSRCLFGAGATSGTASIVRWRSLSYSMMEPLGSLRTLGVWRGGDRSNIDNWEIPRTDTTTASNSSEVGPVIEPMDWQTIMDVRILRTPGWGVSVYRPDLPAPPYYVPSTPGVPGSGFITTTSEPSAAWINMLYGDIPTVSSTFGFVQWGAPQWESVTQQRWSYVRYRLFKVPTEDFFAPTGMLLNRFNVIASGEITRDRAMETVSVQTLDNKRVTLRPAHLYADSIWKVVDGETIFTHEDFTLGEHGQLITLGTDSAGNELTFSGDHASVTVVFIPGKPVTNTYLLNQPLLDGVTLLNEGTPPIPKSMVGEAEYYESVGATGLGPDDSVGAGASVGGYPIAGFKDTPGTQYEDLSFYEVDNGGDTNLIHPFCEDRQEYEFSGTMFWQPYPVPKAVPFEVQQGGGMPGQFLYASGGGYMGPVVDDTGKVIGEAPLGGTLGPGSAVLWPNAPSHNAVAGRGEGHIEQRVEWHIRLRSVLSGAGSVGESTGSAGTTETPLEETWPSPTDELIEFTLIPVGP